MGNYSIRVLEKIIVLFIAMAAGYIAKKTKLVDVSSTKSLSSLLVSITNPCLIIGSLQTDYDKQKLITAAYVFILSFAVHTILAVLTHFIFLKVKDHRVRSVYSFALMYMNCGFMGYPIMMAIFGNEVGLFYGVIYTTAFNLFVWTHGVIIMSPDDKVKLPMRKIFFNPGIISVVISIILFLCRIRLPGVLTEGLDMIGGMTFPLSMMIIGSLLADMNLLSVLKDTKLYCFSFLKLIVIPGIMLAFGYFFHLPQYLALIGLAMCASPSAANTAVFAEVYGNESGLAAKIVGVSTLFSLITMPAMLALSEIILK